MKYEVLCTYTMLPVPGFPMISCTVALLQWLLLSNEPQLNSFATMVTVLLGDGGRLSLLS